MSSDETVSPEHRRRLERIIADYLQAEKAGNPPDREELYRRHPDLERALRKKFAALDQQRDSGRDDETIMVDTATRKSLHLSPDSAQSESARIKFFGDYELLEEVARGGMGVVYKARQSRLNRIVAVKMILGGQLASDRQIKRFLVEAESAANLDHPGIVPIYEFGEHEKTHYFSMAFVDGQSLAQIAADKPMEAIEAAQLLCKITEAIAYAHERGVIHRDLKPANILIDRDGQPRITDFGLAKRVNENSDLTQTGAVMGSVFFMSPEQASGDIEQVGSAADIYALGAILYKLLCGRPPFQAAAPLDTLKQVVENEPVPPRRLNPRIPPDLETICLKCLQKEPGRRYASANDLVAELRRFLAGEPIQARPVGRLEQFARWCRRNPVVSSLSAAIALVLLIGVIVGTTLWNQAQSEYRRAQEEQRMVSYLSRMVLRKTLDETDAWLHQFFVPVQRELMVVRSWGKKGLLESNNPDSLNAMLGPLIEHSPQLSSLMVADERGREHMLLCIEHPSPKGKPPDRQWKCRITRRDLWGDQVQWIEWKGDQKEKKTYSEDLPNYEPRDRPWYKGAISLDSANKGALVHWTVPYRFFTTKDLGITASTSFRRDGRTHVVGFDVMLQDITRFTANKSPTQNGKVLILTGDGSLIGLPQSPRFPDPKSWKEAFLKKPADLGFGVIGDALEKFSLSSEKAIQTDTFQSDGRQWWGGVRSFQLGSDVELWILVIVPDADLRSSFD